MRGEKEEEERRGREDRREEKRPPNEWGSATATMSFMDINVSLAIDGEREDNS